MNEKTKQAIDSALKELSDALERGESEVLREYLDCMSRFPKYSWCNSLLIQRQCPQATQVAGYRKWLELNRFVRKGEKGILIVAPMMKRKRDATTGDEESLNISGYRGVHVFDVSQTEGDPLPDLSKPTGDLGQSLSQIEHLVVSNGIELSYESLPAHTDGFSANGKIGIRESMGDRQRFCTIAHELAHEWLDHHEASLSKQIRETEAEAVAYIVCRSRGLEVPGSSEYIHLYRGNATLLRESLARIQSVSYRIIRGLESDTQVSMICKH